MSLKLGFIGGGNMGTAMISGILSSGHCSKENMIVSDPSMTVLERLTKSYDIHCTTDNTKVMEFADIIFLCVKPHLYTTVIDEIRKQTDESKIIVSIAAGVTLAKLNLYFQKSVKIVRAMPNTPAMVSEGMSALSANENISQEELLLILSYFESFGKAEIVSENLMDTVVGVSGSSPAYVYLLIEAMADAAVADGMPRAKAYTFAAQSVLGAAKMVLETGKHPAELKDAVCSPSGTTIAAIEKLEECGFRHAVIAAQRTCVEKSKKMAAVHTPIN